MGGGVRGIAVHVASRVAAEAEPGQVLVSPTVRDLLLGTPLEMEPLRTVRLRGVPGEWELLSVARTAQT